MLLQASLPPLWLLLQLLPRVAEVGAFPPGADAGWTHVGGRPWFFSPECVTAECLTTLPFVPAPGAGSAVALYNRNTYREFQAEYRFRFEQAAGPGKYTPTGPAGFVFAATNSTAYLALEIHTDGATTLSRYHADRRPERLAHTPPRTVTHHQWHTVRVTVSGTPRNRSAPATVRVSLDRVPLAAWVDGAPPPQPQQQQQAPLNLSELANYGFIGFIASSQGSRPEFWLDPLDFLNASKNSPASFAPLDGVVVSAQGDSGDGGSAPSVVGGATQSEAQDRSPVKPMSVMTFWSGGGSPCIRTLDEHVCNDYAADLRDEADWVTMRGLR